MTPYELGMYAKAYNNKQIQDYKDKVTIAYINAVWTIQWLGKKSQQPKPLEKILDSIGKEKKVMTDDELEKQVRILNRLFGGKEVS